MENFSQPDMLRLLSSPAGHQLLKLLQQQDEQTLSRARAQVESGNYADVKNTLSSLLSDPQVRSLLEQLGGGMSE